MPGKEVRELLLDRMKLCPEEKVVIITDVHSTQIGYELDRQARSIAGRRNVETFFLEYFGDRRDGNGPLQFPDELREALGSARVCVYAAHVKLGELETFVEPMMRAIREHPDLRHTFFTYL